VAAPARRALGHAGAAAVQSQARRDARPAHEARRAEAALLRAQGLTLAEIGARLGVSRQAVHEMLSRAAGAEELDGAR